jgi:hypothetical protein
MEDKKALNNGKPTITNDPGRTPENTVHNNQPVSAYLTGWLLCHPHHRRALPFSYPDDANQAPLPAGLSYP